MAARRRRRVLGLVLLVNVVVIALAAAGVISWWWTAAPAALLVGWLVACRLMVRSERRARTAAPSRRRTAPAPAPIVADEAAVEPPVAETVEETVLEQAAPRLPGMWDPMPVTLPTYVSKPVATRRTVQTIDLDSTGVWSSGHHVGDSVLAREADEAERASRAAPDERRATGS